MQQIHDDEIDLLKSLETLWNDKWLIVAFTFIAILIGTGYIYYKKPLYESKITYSTDNIPPFYKSNKILSDFKKKFYSKKNFDDWKKIIGKTSLAFQDFSDVKVVDGFVIKKSLDQQLATIKDVKPIKDTRVIIINTNQLAILEDFYKYAIFINENLNKDYVQRAQDELKIMELRYKDLSSSNIIQTVLSIDRFVVTAKKGESIFKIDRPNMPIKISPQSTLTIILSSILGGIIGMFYVLISNSIRNRK